jgi:hypothetical protein
MTGRPSKYTPEIVEEILERLAAGEPLTEICEDDHMPGWRTVYDWEAKHEGLTAAIVRARSYGHDVIAARTRQTARGDGDSTGDVQRDKLIIETDLKLLAKWNPRYADKLAHVGGGSEDAPIRSESSVSLSGLTDDQLRALASIKV